MTAFESPSKTSMRRERVSRATNNIDTFASLSRDSIPLINFEKVIQIRLRGLGPVRVPQIRFFATLIECQESQPRLLRWSKFRGL